MTKLSRPLPHRVATLLSTKTPHVYSDGEFGDISYRRLANARYVRIRLSTNGRLQATLPVMAPLSSLTRLIDNSREQLRRLTITTPENTYADGQHIGHSHTLQLVPNKNGIIKAVIAKQKIVISYPAEQLATSTEVQAVIRDYAAKALRRESKAYLPRRLQYLADQGDFSYQKVRFAHQSGRWGSCSSSGTISLNIALMNLPFELIDYVLVHELAHTKHMNHSPRFWATVEQFYPQYKNARKLLKNHNPYL